MMLLFSIFTFIWVAFVYILCATLLKNGSQELKDMKKTSASGWANGIVLGLVVGAINYVAVDLAWKILLLAPILLIVMFIFMIAVTLWGKRKACEWVEYLALAALLLPMVLTSKELANATAVLVNHEFWGSLIVLLPWLVFIVGIFAFVADWFMWRAKECEEGGDEDDK